MAAKKKGKPTTRAKSTSGSEAKFSYTTKPASLRRLLKEIPKKPKPPKFDRDLLRSWGFGDSNDQTMLRVLKAVGLLNDRNEPTEIYSRFMNMDGGAKALGPEIRRVYAPLFNASLAPYTESNEKLQNLFNIHSGGGDRSLEYQIQTFKALCENAVFEEGDKPNASPGAKDGSLPRQNEGSSASMASGININVHIHLPDNKSRRDYEDIIENIGRYIFGRETGAPRE